MAEILAHFALPQVIATCLCWCWFMYLCHIILGNIVIKGLSGSQHPVLLCLPSICKDGCICQAVHTHVPIAHKLTQVLTYTFINISELWGFSGIFWLCYKIWIGEVFEQLQGKVEQIISLNEHLHTEFISLVSVISLLCD